MGTPGQPYFAVNGLVADFADGTLWDASGHPIPLRPQAFAVLRCLAERPRSLVTKDEIMAAVWPGIAVTDDSLVQAISDIRRAIGDGGHAVLRTVPRRGYRLVLPDPAAPAERARRARRWPLAAGALPLVVGAAALWWSFARPEKPAASVDGPPFVAMQSFINVTGDEASRRLVTGLKKDLFADLSQSRELQIVLPSSTYVYEDHPPDVVKVDFVFGGAVNHQGDRFRTTASLFDARTGNLLWSERWDRPDDGDLLALQTEISKRIESRLGGGAGVIQEVLRTSAHRKRPDDLTAYELYLLGMEKLELFSRADVAAAIRLLRRAVERGPELARAWVELSLAHDAMADFGADPEANRRAAAEAAARAVEVHHGDGKAHAALATSLRHAGALARAGSEFDTAVVLAPDVADVLTLDAGWSATDGAPERGAEAADRAARLYLTVPTRAAPSLAYGYFMAGRYEAALEMLDRLTADNHTLMAWAMHPAALATLGRSEEAAAWVEKAAAARPDLTIEAIANQPGYGDAERRRLVETMRLAGFPACATPEARAKFEKAVRLPECEPRAGRQLP
jgi:DNA-binding winged helix-turn-helix (wHTH) protein/TolB-like protein/Tfp pilus assembly protein PilF